MFILHTLNIVLFREEEYFLAVRLSIAGKYCIAVTVVYEYLLDI